MNTHMPFMPESPVVNMFSLSAVLISLPTCLFTFGLIKGIYAEIWKPFRKTLGFCVADEILMNIPARVRGTYI